MGIDEVGDKSCRKTCSSVKFSITLDADNYLSDLKSMKYYCKGRGCRHQGLPEFKPTALCFYIRGSECSHVDVKHRIEDLLGVCPGAKIESIQFVPLSVHLDTVDSDQRYSTDAINSII